MKLKTCSIIAVALSGVFSMATASSAQLSNELQNAKALTVTLAPARKGLAITQISGAFESALLSVASLRASYSDHWLVYGARPGTLDELGYAEDDFQNELVQHVSLAGETGAILIGLSDRFGDKQWAALIPQFDGYELTGWICQTTLDQSAGDGADCVYDVPYARVDRVFDPAVFSSALTAVSFLKVGYSEFYASTGQVPTAMDELAVEPGLLTFSYISHVMVDPNTKAMIIGLDDEMYGFNQWVSLTPTINRYGYLSRWSCRTTVSSEVVNASGAQGCAPGQGVEDMLFSVLARGR